MRGCACACVWERKRDEYKESDKRERKRRQAGDTVNMGQGRERYLERLTNLMVTNLFSTNLI